MKLSVWVTALFAGAFIVPWIAFASLTLQERADVLLVHERRLQGPRSGGRLLAVKDLAGKQGESRTKRRLDALPSGARREPVGLDRLDSDAGDAQGCALVHGKRPDSGAAVEPRRNPGLGKSAVPVEIGESVGRAPSASLDELIERRERMTIAVGSRGPLRESSGCVRATYSSPSIVVRVAPAASA